MQVVRAMPWKEVVEKIGGKILTPSKMDSEQWRPVPSELRERAFFSSKVESARALQTLRDPVTDFLNSAVETLPSGERALKTGSRAQFVDQMQTALQKIGI